MADDKNIAKKDNSSAPPEKYKPPFAVHFSVFMLFVTAAVFLPSTIVFSVCMIPTLVAAIVDSHEQKTAWLTVGAMNLAGTVPNLFTLWDTGHTIPAAFNLAFQPAHLLVAYGGACVGWVIYYNIPPFVAGLVLSKNERRLKAIDNRQKELVKKWGENVVTE